MATKKIKFTAKKWRWYPRFIKWLVKVNTITRMGAVVYSSVFQFIGLVMIILSTYSFMIQFHNLDLSYNMALMTNDINDNLRQMNLSIDSLNYRLLEDRYDFGKSAPYTDFYVYSIAKLPVTLFGVFIGSLFLAFGFFWNLSLHGKRIYASKR